MAINVKQIQDLPKKSDPSIWSKIDDLNTSQSTPISRIGLDQGNTFSWERPQSLW